MASGSVTGRERSLLEEVESSETSTAEEEHSAVEKRILKHAMRSFARRGYAATTLRGVAASAGVTAPLLSYYFKSKEGLFLKVAEIVMQSLERRVHRAASEEHPFHVAVHSVVEAHLELGERSPAAVEFMLGLLYGPQEGQPAPDLHTMYAGTRRTIDRVFDRGLASGELRLRPGVTKEFLVERLTSLVHDLAVRRFRAARLLEQFPERREEIEAMSRQVSTRVALEHFFLGAGDVPAWRDP